MITKIAKQTFLGALGSLTGGRVRIESADGVHSYGTLSDLDTTLVVTNDRFFWRAISAADVGVGESFMDGDWASPDLVPLIRLMIRNRRTVDGHTAGMFHRLLGGLARRLRDNSRAGSRRHIHKHYDLGNDFFQLFLDDDLRMYSCALFESAADSLETAQARKIDRICRLLDLQPSDRVLEIGSGWGGFASWAASRYGCHVTTTTISDEQFRYVSDWQAAAGAIGRQVEVLRADYRELAGAFDKIVSIEMFEAVGLSHYDEFFGAVDRLLVPGGSMMLQTITIDDQSFPQYHGSADWIEKYIFPGGELASIAEIVSSLARVTSLSMYQAENFGTHYARTLHLWRSRFHDRIDHVRALGFDERFIRMWDFYLASCEAAFLERHTGLFQIMLTKNRTQRQLFNEPWNLSGAWTSSDVAPVGRPRIADAREPAA